jgi:carotenoid cleavage dioxygenase-like enzyme
MCVCAQVVWLDDLPASFLFHFANAWEEQDGRVIR